MKRILERLMAVLILGIFWIRYRVKIKGLEKLNPNSLSKPGGILFIPNHPAVFIDPTLVTLAIWKKYSVRHLIVEYMYYTPGIHLIMKWLRAIPVPNNEVSSNTLKRKRSDKAFVEVAKGLKNHDNFMIYPAGRLKNSAQEILGGASGVHRIIQEAPETNVVLVRITGLWGSSFSKAFTGVTPPMFQVLKNGFFAALKSLIFFLPRRNITIEFEPAPADFPYLSPRLEFNKYLERWYNRPDGLSEPASEYPGETLNLVSLSRWSEQYPKVNMLRPQIEGNVEIDKIRPDIQESIKAKLAEMTERNPESIKPEMDLSTDLGIDSLDVSELAIYLEDQYNVTNIPVIELSTVSKVMGFAAKQIVIPQKEEDNADITRWAFKRKAERLQIAPGKTMPEVFLNSCDKYLKSPAMGDQRAGILYYAEVKLRAILLALKIRKMPGKYIGILLPSSVASTLTIFACQLAGKIPLMVNWTVGAKHLESVKELSGVETVLTSWAFIDRLANFNLTPIEDDLIMLEDVRRDISIFDKLKAFWLSKKKTASLLKYFGVANQTEKDTGVLLFTSGTESMPKGVPLSYENLLSNQRSAVACLPLLTSDVLLAILPPFHSFGFSICSTLGILAGMRIAYFPDPTDGKKVANNVEHWNATVLCGAPTFLRNTIKAAGPDQLKSLRIIVSGAEKTPQELFDLVEKAGLGHTIIEAYGITECSPGLSANELGKPAKGVGKPLPDVELCIVHPETHELLKTHEQGLILARGPNIFSGYLNKGATSPFLNVNGKEWYITGDLGSLDEENNLTISGRLKRFIKVGPEMISLSAIEEALLVAAQKRGWELAQEGASLAICAKEITGEKPKIVLFCKFPASVEEVNRELREAGFTNLVKISSVQQLNEIPLMGTGKVNYRVLESTYLTDNA